MPQSTQATAPHQTGEPPILYFGTPVVLISSCNADGSTNLAPMSSAFWLGWRCMMVRLRILAACMSADS